MNEIELDIKAKSAPRPRCRMLSRKLATPYMPKDYMIYKQNIQTLLKRHDITKYSGMIELEIEFLFSMPKSWSKKKKIETLMLQNVTNNKDVDNLAKGIMDSMNGLLFDDDRQVTSLLAKKRYAEFDKIKIKIKEIDNGKF